MARTSWLTVGSEVAYQSSDVLVVVLEIDGAEAVIEYENGDVERVKTCNLYDWDDIIELERQGRYGSAMARYHGETPQE